jgi:hypothetical protein
MLLARQTTRIASVITDKIGKHHFSSQVARDAVAELVAAEEPDRIGRQSSDEL